MWYNFSKQLYLLIIYNTCKTQKGDVAMRKKSLKSRLAQKILCSVLAASVLGITANFNVAEAADEVITTSAALTEDKTGGADDTITFKNAADTGVRGVVTASKDNDITISGYKVLNVYSQESSSNVAGDGLVSDGANLIVENIDTVNIGSSEQVFQSGGQTIHGLNHTVSLENIGELNINTNGEAIMAQHTGLSDAPDKPSVSITTTKENGSTGNVNITTHGSTSEGIMAASMNKNPGIAAVSIVAAGKVTITADGNGLSSFDTDATAETTGWKGEGKTNITITGADGVDITSNDMGIRVARTNKLNDSGLLIESANGDVNISGKTYGIYLAVSSKLVEPEGSKNGITGKIVGNNVNITASKNNAIEILNNGNLTAASNVENGTITVNSKDVAIKVTGAGSILNLGSEKINNNITVNGAVQAVNSGTVNLSGTATESSTGKYSATGNGNINFNKGSWTVKDWSGEDGNMSVGTGAQVTLNDNVEAATVTLKDGSTTIVDAAEVSGTVITATTTNVGENAAIKVNNFDTGSTIKLFSDDNANEKVITNEQVTTNNLMQTVTLDDNKNLVIGVADASEVLPDVAIGGIITGLTANNVHNAFFDDVLKSGDAAKASEALNSVANMGELAGVNHGTYSMSNQMTDAVADHLSIATHGEQDKDIWAHYIHNKEDIDGMNLGGIDGSYEAQYNGIVVGSDLYKNGKTTAGIALSYADGNITGSNSVSSTKNEAEYYGASLYGRIDNGDSAILGDITYMHSDNDITQHNSGHEITASADADAFSIGIRAEQAYAAGAGKFVPYAGIRYMHLGAGNYDNSLGMDYDADDQNLWLLPVGVTYRAEVQSGDWTVKPIAEVGYVWTMGDRDTDQTVSLNGAADTFGFETADSGSFVGRLGIEAEKADVTYGLSYEYQKGDTVKANKWMANLTFSF